MKPSSNLENDIPPDTNLSFQLICMKVSAYNSLEPLQEYN